MCNWKAQGGRNKKGSRDEGVRRDGCRDGENERDSEEWLNKTDGRLAGFDGWVEFSVEEWT